MVEAGFRLPQLRGKGSAAMERLVGGEGAVEPGSRVGGSLESRGRNWMLRGEAWGFF